LPKILNLNVPGANVTGVVHVAEPTAPVISEMQMSYVLALASSMGVVFEQEEQEEQEEQDEKD
jgi:hypothetical protein